MSADNSSAPAFPGSEKNGDGSHHYSHPGLTKREEFARSAMQGMVTGYWTTDACGLSPEEISEHAVGYADALLAALAKGGDE